MIGEQWALDEQHAAGDEPELQPLDRGYLDLSDLRAPMHYEALFGRRAPVELEIGAGRGDFLLRYAPGCPEHDFIGLERKLVILRKAVNKLRRSPLSNVRLINAEARNLLANYFAPGSLRAIHVYFPDPWPKKRHAHRRVFAADSLEAMVRLIEPGGFLHIRTDHPLYFDTMMELTSGREDLAPVEIPAGLLAARTAFEDRFIARGVAIHRASFQVRRPGAATA